MEICPLQRWHTIAVTPRHRSDLMNATPTVKVILTLYVEENGEILCMKYFRSRLTVVQVPFNFTSFELAVLNYF